MSILSSFFPPLRRAFVTGFAALMGLIVPALAFPPALPFTINGITRDAYGWSFKSTDLATVVINSTVL